MNKWLLTTCLFLTCKIFFPQDLFDFEHSFCYGKYLFERQEYNLAIPELERAVFLNPSDTLIANLLIKSYFLSGQHNMAEKKVDELFLNLILPVSISHLYIKSSIKLNHFENFSGFNPNKYSLNYKDTLFYSISTNIYKKEYEPAKTKLENINSDSYAIKYINLLNDKNYTKHKSPGLSMFLSSVVPGTGKVYTGYWKDGLVSMVFIGTSAYQAVRGFNKKGTDSFYGWFFGSISVSLYLGNIYGSGKSAHKRNYVIEEKYYNEADHILFNY